jgi:hypothetical protein
MLRMKDFIKESWFLQEILQQGRDEERARFEQECEQALEMHRQIVVAVVEKSYASLVPLVKKKVGAISDPSVLQQLLLHVCLASDEEEVRKFLEAE